MANISNTSASSLSTSKSWDSLEDKAVGAADIKAVPWAQISSLSTRGLSLLSPINQSIKNQGQFGRVQIGENKKIKIGS